MTKQKTSKPNWDYRRFSSLNDLKDQEYNRKVFDEGYIEGLRGYLYEGWMLNPYKMDYRKYFIQGFHEGLDQHKRNILEQLILGDNNVKKTSPSGTGR